MVTAGHAAKMRNAKDLATTSKGEMAAMFGIKNHECKRNSLLARLADENDEKHSNPKEK